jgi:histidine triad (HIT) family protein
VAFFPDDPATPGHTLVIPRRHVEHLWATDATLAADLMAAVVRVGKAIYAALSPDGMNLITSAGIAAEQTVPHLHLHVVPRWASDRIGPIWPPKEPLNDHLSDDLAAAIREFCASD